MIDIHAHILPGIDDGARDIYESLEMARVAAEHGTTAMVATPHCNIPGRFDNFVDGSYRRVFEETVRAIRQAEIPLTLYPGMEVYLTPEVPERIPRGELMPLNGSRYLLVEFDFGEEAEQADRMLRMVQDRGLTPVVAHVERYYFLQEDLNWARIWRERGYVIQCNKGSFGGRFGHREHQTAYRLMDRDLVDVIASDTHRPQRRSPNLEDAWVDLSHDYPESLLVRLFEENPGRLIRNREPVRL